MSRFFLFSLFYNNNMNTQRALNTVRTLPRLDLIKSHDLLLKELLASRQDHSSKVYDPIILQYRKGKNIFSFFKEGLLNLYRARRDLNREIFNGKMYIQDYGMGDSQGKLIVRWSDYDKVLDSIARRISLVEMERKAGKKVDKVDYGLAINREQFIEMVQIKKEWFKVPMFGLLFLILEELSLPIVYLFPQMLPKTCVLPGMIERRYNSNREKAFEKLNDMTDGKATKHLETVLSGEKSVWGIPESQLGAYCTYLGIFGMGSRDKRMKLMRHIRELEVLRHMGSE